MVSAEGARKRGWTGVTAWVARVSVVGMSTFGPCALVSRRLRGVNRLPPPQHAARAVWVALWPPARALALLGLHLGLDPRQLGAQLVQGRLGARDLAAQAKHLSESGCLHKPDLRAR